tara:strand:+ start:114 stop:416 length:303 start_codon:yes stop_codon:yes gene_type:complete
VKTKIKVELVEEAIKNAAFDRKRFRVKAIESADGTEVELYADTVHRDSQGKLSTNYSSIPVDSVSRDPACKEELRMLVESTVSMLAAFVEEQSNSEGTVR